MHNEVPCPGWRKLQDSELIPVCDENGDDADADSDTFPEEDSAFLEMHDSLAQEERARWTGYSVKTKSAATKGGRSGGNNANSKSKSSKRSRSSTLETIYPTAMESFLLVEEAKAKYLSQPNLNGLNFDADSDKEAELRRNLQYFKEPLAAFARIEACILEQKHKMRAILKLRKEEEAQLQRTYSTMATGSPGVSGVSKKKRARHTQNILRTSQRQMAEMMREERALKPRLDLALIELSLSRLDSIENVIDSKSASLYSAFEDLLKQANWNIPKVRSFNNMSAHYKDALQKSRRDANGNMNGSHDTEATAASENRLARYIRSGIDTSKYPLVAKTFKLHKDYQIDGCAPRSGWKSKSSKSFKHANANGHPQNTQENNNKSSSNGNTLSCDEENTLSYSGFSLPMHALNSEPESDDEVANPLTGDDVWAAVQKRISKKTNNFLKETVQPGDVELDISLSIQQAIIHPDDRCYLNDSTEKDNNDDNDPQAQQPNESTVTHQVSFDDDLAPVQQEDPGSLAIARLELNPVQQQQQSPVDAINGTDIGNGGDSNPVPAVTVPPGGTDAEMVDKGAKALTGDFNPATAPSLLNANGPGGGTTRETAAGCTEPLAEKQVTDAAVATQGDVRNTTR